MEVYEMSKFFPWKKFKRYHPVQWRYEGNIYIEKFTNIGTSELSWDISRFFNDVTDVNGYLSHWHTIVKSAQSCGQ